MGADKLKSAIGWKEIRKIQYPGTFKMVPQCIVMKGSSYNYGGMVGLIVVGLFEKKRMENAATKSKLGDIPVSVPHSNSLFHWQNTWTRTQYNCSVLPM